MLANRLQKWAAIALAGVVIAYGITSYIENLPRNEAETFVNEMLPDILANWDRDALLQRADESLLTLAQNNEAEFSALFTRWAALGDLRDHRTWRCTIADRKAYNPEAAMDLQAHCTASVEFRRGFAIVNTDVRNTGAGWKFVSISIDSPSL